MRGTVYTCVVTQINERPLDFPFTLKQMLNFLFIITFKEKHNNKTKTNSLVLNIEILLNMRYHWLLRQAY